MKKKLYVILSVIIGLFLIYALYYVFRFIVPPTLGPGGYETAVVDRGLVMKTANAEGFVEPENEVLLRSPASSVIKKIFNEPGSYVDLGEVILILDPKPIEYEIENLEDQLAVKRNNLHKNRLNAQSIGVDLEYNVEMKKLKIASIKSELADQEQLLEVGGISTARYEKTKQELVFTEKDLEMILKKNSIRLRQLEAEEKGLLIQIKIQEKDLSEKKEILKKMVIRAPSAGIILNVYGKEGENKNIGQLLVMMSDLTSFKINGSTDEKFSDLVKTGKAVYAIVDRERLPGKIGNIKPLIEDNKIQFDVFLEESSHQKLMPNLKVNMLIVRTKKDSVLRIKIGTAFGNEEKMEVFVIESDKAVRKEIVTGLKGPDYMEIISGVREGDHLIISDISSFRHMKEVEIQKY